MERVRVSTTLSAIFEMLCRTEDSIYKSGCKGRNNPHQHPGAECRRGSSRAWLCLKNQRESFSERNHFSGGTEGHANRELVRLCHKHIFVWECVPPHCFYMKHHQLLSVLTEPDGIIVVVDNTVSTS